MADFKNIIFPAGWVSMGGEPRFDVTRIGRPGRWQIIANDDFSVWTIRASFLRSGFETVAEHAFDAIYNFFLNTGAAYSFLVEDEMDSATGDMGGSGIVKMVGGVYRLFKRYPAPGSFYDHPITRPKSPVALEGGAAGGTVNYSTGVVTGISAPGTWAGNFYRPMVFADGGLSYKFAPDGTIEAFDVALEEQLEL